MPRNALDISNLSHRYGNRTALRRIDLSVPQGMLFGLLGPNGGGKTTLFRIVSTLLAPTEGSAAVLGFDVVRDRHAIRRRVGVVLQDVALDDELTVRENLHAHGALHGLSARGVQERLSRLLPLFGLEDRVRERVGTLSGGLKRRVDLVRGLLHAPPLLLLDEPTSGLDPAARHAFWEILQRLRRREEITILVATHVMEEADRCDRLAIIDGGRLVTDGSPQELKNALGAETLWIESDDAVELARRLKMHFDVAARVIGSRIQISDPNAHTLLSSLYEYHGDAVRSATVRRPTLEDVFMVHAGHGIEDEELSETNAEADARVT